ncbi:alpha/beta fold hydrolase [Euzebya tangerina]|uniref:alpha/beta fold hydrolase n=1 Tax=Euzebya tangerina TaxID=591198 RepID=UPI000E3101A5|nr:alpha/beta hydrolase [Euzebya tangerina]
MTVPSSALSSPPPEIRRHRVAIDGGRALNVRERSGDDRAFLLVHGLASNARLWDGVSAELAGRGHRVVAVDQRGHGLSDRARTGYRYPEVVGDLVALAEVLGLHRPVLVGQSWGGNVVIHAGAQAGSRWHAIGAVDGGTINLGDTFDDAQAAWEALRPPPLAGRPASEVRDMIAGSVQGWPAGALEAQMGNFEIFEDGTLAPHLALGDHRQIVEAMLTSDPRDVYDQVDLPVLLMPVRGGTGEWAERKAAAVEEAIELLPDGRVQWFDGAHDVHLQKPAEVAEALLTLL